jgi:hypothetical protein
MRRIRVALAQVNPTVGAIEANARLVAANSWPFLSYGPGVVTTNGVARIHMQVSNTGVGPAKIESAELVWKGVAYRSDPDFLKAQGNYSAVTRLTYQASSRDKIRFYLDRQFNGEDYNADGKEESIQSTLARYQDIESADLAGQPGVCQITRRRTYATTCTIVVAAKS